MTRLMYKIYTSEILPEPDVSDEDSSSSSRSDHNKEAEEFEDEDNVIPVVIETDNGREGQDLQCGGEQYSNPRKVSLLSSESL